MNLLQEQNNCRFFTTDQAVVWAIGAYRDATRALRLECSEPTPADFADLFEHAFFRRLLEAWTDAGDEPAAWFSWSVPVDYACF